MKLGVKKLDPRAIVPKYATAGAAGADVFACIDEPIHLHPGESRLVPLGFSMQLPHFTAAYLLPRSGLGSKSGIVLGNLVGLVDEDFRGQVHACVWNRNHDGEAFTINLGDRIGQIVIAPVIRAEFVVVDELGETARGSGGFGSTGK